MKGQRLPLLSQGMTWYLHAHGFSAFKIALGDKDTVMEARRRIEMAVIAMLRKLAIVTIGPSAVDGVVRYWHRVGGESLVARRRGSGVRLPLGLVVARQSQALCRTYN